MLLTHAGVLCTAERRANAAEIDVPVSCGSRAEFESEVERRLGRQSPLQPLDVHIHAEAAAYTLRMRVGNEQRELHDSDCRALFRAAVVITAAITLSETRERRSAPAAPSGTRSNEVQTAPVMAQRQTAQSPRELEIALGLEGGVNFGLLPEPARQLGLLAKVRRKQLGLELSARYLGPADRQESSGRGVSVQGVNAELAALYRLSVLELSLAGTGALLFGSGYGEGRRSDFAWAFGPAASLMAIPFENSFMWVGVGGSLYWNLLNPQFEILNYGQIFSSSTVTGSLFLRIGPRFQ